jgi:hypothetical protein
MCEGTHFHLTVRLRKSAATTKLLNKASRITQVKVILPVDVMHEYKRSTGTAPLILIIETKLEVSGQLHEQAGLPLEKKTPETI